LTIASPRPRSASAGRQVGKLTVESYVSRAEMGGAAAASIAQAIRTTLAGQDQARMIFAAAPSQAEMLDTLRLEPGIDWRRVTAFHMDEYIGLPPEASERFAAWLDRHLFTRLPFRAVHRIVPEPDPEAAAWAYAEALAAAPIDIVCLGIGINGHIAFNDPPVADFGDPRDVKVVPLDDLCRRQQVDDDCFARLEDVPHTAITLTVPRLLRAERLFCVVPGAAKREAVRGTLYGPITTDCPASILRTADCTLYLDSESDSDVQD
jgi:glucosamine-6-phosphate deaminase